MAAVGAHGATGTTATGATKAARIPRFEGLRGLLAFGVVAYHVAFQSGVSSFIDQPGKGFWGVLADGLGVCLPPFFALSGMMLYRPWARAVFSGTPTPATPRFLKRRALRILPAYWLLLAFALPGYNWYEIDGPGDVLRPLLLMHFYLPDGQPMHGLEPTWTVPAEFTFYLALPVIAWIAHRIARGGRTPQHKARRLLLPLIGLEIIAMAWVTRTNWPGTGATVEWYWPPYYAGCFAAGMAIAVYLAYTDVAERTPAFHRFVTRRPLACWAACVPLFFLYALKPIGTPGMGDYPALVQELLDHAVLTAFTLLLIAPMTVPGARSRFMDGLLTNRPVLYLGQVSLGVYLWHEIVINLWLKNGAIFGSSPVPTPEFRGQMGFFELLAFTLTISVALASVSYYLVERPVIRLGERTARRTPAPPARTADTGRPATDGDLAPTTTADRS